MARIQGLDQVVAFTSEWRNPLRIRVPGSDMPYVVMAKPVLEVEDPQATVRRHQCRDRRLSRSRDVTITSDSQASPSAYPPRTSVSQWTPR
jgi:hypothetical protein